jgi:phage terminase small subunit
MDTRLIIVEGIMGSGKSTLSRFIARQVSLSRGQAMHIRESKQPHPTNLVRLSHQPPQWDSLDPIAVAEGSLRKWQRFVASLRESDRVHVFDAHLLHWDFTTLLLADVGLHLVRDYAKSLFAIVSEANPALIYLHQADPDRALRRIALVRGDEWLQQQIDSKTSSPYCIRRSMRGVEGWLHLYRDYRCLVDSLVASSGLRVLSVDTSAGRWRTYNAQVLRFLGLEPVPAWKAHALAWRSALSRRLRERNVGCIDREPDSNRHGG